MDQRDGTENSWTVDVVARSTKAAAETHSRFELATEAMVSDIPVDDRLNGVSDLEILEETVRIAKDKLKRGR